MMTVSSINGTPAGLQMDGLNQLPLATVSLIAALENIAESSNRSVSSVFVVRST